MGYRVDKIKVHMAVYVEFGGSHEIEFEYSPETDDPLVKLALAKNNALNMEAAKQDRSNMTWPFL
jgi:hypothetical protein